ncbi:TPA: type I methionyl aminopeptidase [Candidatus Saccharibacteria bacterium]|nr:type I methionyl aminopeptidase [Candidatus Saccharibacteria bacterium]HRK41293.1 type I methionyl aminopeptidase [Candidatus Saccharibacteria bacterium]
MFGRIKTDDEIQAMRDGGKLLATIFEGLKKQVRAGVSELELDAWVAKEIVALGAEATYKTSEVNFPASICISTNEDVVHGVPTEYVLKKGDVVGFDLVVSYKGMKTDSAFTLVVDEKPSGDKQRLLEYTERSLYAGIDVIKGPVRVGDISAAVEKVLHEGRLGIVRELVGHGVGHSMHQAPDIPNYGNAGKGFLLEPGDTIAIEPMTTLGHEDIVTDADGWTIKTRDGSLAAHFEHTVLITETGAEILTKI